MTDVPLANGSYSTFLSCDPSKKAPEFVAVGVLHQLRGRVGRSEIKSYCILVSNTKNPETRQRLKALCKTRDGFAIAQADLELRGPGDLFGQRQHGLPVLRCAALGSSVPVLQAAQEAAAAYLADPASPDGPEFAPLMDRVRRLFDHSAELFL